MPASGSAASSTPQGASNVELYKQLDVLREENFQLKQKQREMMLTVNTLKTENEQLLDNAESEIKRMSDFVDKFTQDTEANKKKIINDYEQRLSQERVKAEETRQRLNLEKADVEAKMVLMQKELEVVKQENMQMQLAKSDSMQKQIELFEQLEQTKHQLRQAQTQLIEQKRRDSSPITSQQQPTPSYQRPAYYQKYDEFQQSNAKPPVFDRIPSAPQRYENYQNIPAEVSTPNMQSQNNSGRK